MEKYIKNWIIAFIGWALITAMMYLCASFILVDFNFINWDKGTRAFIAVFSGTFFLLTFLFAAGASQY